MKSSMMTSMHKTSPAVVPNSTAREMQDLISKLKQELKDLRLRKEVEVLEFNTRFNDRVKKIEDEEQSLKDKDDEFHKRVSKLNIDIEGFETLSNSWKQERDKIKADCKDIIERNQKSIDANQLEARGVKERKENLNIKINNANEMLKTARFESEEITRIKDDILKKHNEVAVLKVRTEINNKKSQDMLALNIKNGKDIEKAKREIMLLEEDTKKINNQAVLMGSEIKKLNEEALEQKENLEIIRKSLTRQNTAAQNKAIQAEIKERLARREQGKATKRKKEAKEAEATFAKKIKEEEK